MMRAVTIFFAFYFRAWPDVGFNETADPQRACWVKDLGENPSAFA
jgi:hypothetical protein